MEYNSSLPIYLQAANSIKRDIVTGKLSPGVKLPSVRELAVAYTINPSAISAAYIKNWRWKASALPDAGWELS
ncbi:MAG: GntR family transcriptional regulator [Clostridia bacterium]